MASARPRAMQLAAVGCGWLPFSRFQWPLRGLGQCNRVNRVPEELMPEFQWPLRGLGQCNQGEKLATFAAAVAVSMASARPRAMQRHGC